MEQDELEDEVFTKTIVTHLGIISKFALGVVDWDCLITKRETFCVLAVFIALLLWLLHSSKNSFGFFWKAVPMAGLAGLDSGGNEFEEQLDHAAVVALRGRRSTMEDRFVMVKIEPEVGQKSGPTIIHAVLDGHGGEFAVIYVKKHLMENLVQKIQLLKLIVSMTSSSRKAEQVKKFERLNKSQMSKSVMDYIGLSMADYKEISPLIQKTIQDQPEEIKKEEPKPVITSSLVLSSRVKPIEELPTISDQNDKAETAKPGMEFKKILKQNL